MREISLLPILLLLAAPACAASRPSAAALVPPVADPTAAAEARAASAARAAAAAATEVIPPRPLDAITGTRFGENTRGWEGRARQAAAVEQLLDGNLPDALRELRAVTLTADRADGTTLEATIWVMPDYLAVGDDDDFLYVPLTMPSATTVTREWGFVLPTCKMVDAIYDQSDHHFTPIPMTPGPKMRSSAYYLEHQRMIDEQRHDVPLDALVSGHKKDVVLSGRLAETEGRIAIYGWHEATGDPIQPLCLWHGARYADYSHGVRLVWEMIWIEGKLLPILDVLEDPALAPALTYEGTIPDGGELLHEDGEPWPD